MVIFLSLLNLVFNNPGTVYNCVTGWSLRYGNWGFPLTTIYQKKPNTFIEIRYKKKLIIMTKRLSCCTFPCYIHLYPARFALATFSSEQIKYCVQRDETQKRILTIFHCQARIHTCFHRFTKIGQIFHD